MENTNITEQITKRFNKLSPSIASNLVTSFFTENLTQISKNHKIPINKINNFETKLFFNFTGDESQDAVMSFLTQVACLDEDEARSVFKEVQDKFLTYLDKSGEQSHQDSKTEKEDLYLEKIE